MRMIPSGTSVAAGQSITVVVAVESNSGNVIVQRAAGRGRCALLTSKVAAVYPGRGVWGAGMWPVHRVSGSETAMNFRTWIANSKYYLAF